MFSSEEEKQIWAGFASSALAGILAGGLDLGDVEDEEYEDGCANAASEAALLADKLLAEFIERQGKPRRRARGRTED